MGGSMLGSYNTSWSKGGRFISGAAYGGLSSAALGGDFWQGVATSATVTLTNHFMHECCGGGHPPKWLEELLIKIYGKDGWIDRWKLFLDQAGNDVDLAVERMKGLILSYYLGIELPTITDSQKGGIVNLNSGKGRSGSSTVATEHVEHCIDCAPSFGGNPANLGERASEALALLNRIFPGKQWQIKEIRGDSIIYDWPSGVAIGVGDSIIMIDNDSKKVIKKNPDWR
jgi:hypothetical protein